MIALADCGGCIHHIAGFVVANQVSQPFRAAMDGMRQVRFTCKYEVHATELFAFDELLIRSLAHCTRCFCMNLVLSN